jgi:hypothetical protein
VARERVTAEERARRLGLLAPAELDKVMAKLQASGKSERWKAAKCDCAPSSVHYAIQRTKGIARKQYRSEPCDGCGRQFPASELQDFFCKACAAYEANL